MMFNILHGWLLFPTAVWLLCFSWKIQNIYPTPILWLPLKWNQYFRYCVILLLRKTTHWVRQSSCKLNLMVDGIASFYHLIDLNRLVYMAARFINKYWRKYEKFLYWTVLSFKWSAKKKNGDLLSTISGPKKTDLEMLCIHFDLQTGMNL